MVYYCPPHLMPRSCPPPLMRASTRTLGRRRTPTKQDSPAWRSPQHAHSPIRNCVCGSVGCHTGIIYKDDSVYSPSIPSLPHT
ncbi:hypothetical protein E2C01_009620 [Portunus trituberculatus]|uniref:Uncharacterized protein n=1 Tax=Portunus trituberculatus TaxID=210409 RepID=A0A5B7D6A2_PORTR|nr:hypothetical protein [Portunus trituberculatus]